MPPSSANFSAGMILPRAMPAMSGMMASTSEMPWSRKNCRISLTIRLGFSLCCGALTAGLPERCEQRPRKRITHHLPLRVPLYRERKALRVAHPERLDHSVRRARFDRELGPEAIDPLAVERIHANAVARGEGPHPPAGLERRVARRAVLPLERLRPVVAMIEMPRHLVQLLVQRAAEGDVHLLEAATDTEHRHSRRHGLADQGKRRRIARRVMERPGRARRPLVPVRLDVRGAAGEEQ